MNRRADRAVTAVLAAVSYLPILLSSPGSVSADTKTYLTVDPARLLSGGNIQKLILARVFERSPR